MHKQLSESACGDNLTLVWKPVRNASSYGVELDRYNEVTFDPVTTTELKIEIQFQKGRCCALIRWRVE